MSPLQQVGKRRVEENSDSVLGLIERAKVGEWIRNSCLPEAINISVITVFFWNKPRFCPILFLSPPPQLPYSSMPLLLPAEGCHHCHPPTCPHVPLVFSIWQQAQAASWDARCHWQVARVTAHLFMLVPFTSQEQTLACVWGFLCVFYFICKQEGFKLSSPNKWGEKNAQRKRGAVRNISGGCWKGL